MEDLILLDTGILFNFLADREGADVIEEILEKGKGVISAITIYELFRGVREKKHVEQRQRLSTYLHKLDITDHIARIASDLYTNLQRTGNIIDNEDILIGATALYHRLQLFTPNHNHFNRIPKLQLYKP